MADMDTALKEAMQIDGAIGVALVDYTSGYDSECAVLFPETEFVLVDRAGRRVDLAKRAVRILDLENVTVRQEEIERLPGPLPAIVARASLPPQRLEPQVRRLLAPGGVAVVGGDGRQLIYVPMRDGGRTPDAPVQAVVPELVAPAGAATTADPVRTGRSGRTTSREEDVR